jgi:hypothetical protein
MHGTLTDTGYAVPCAPPREVLAPDIARAIRRDIALWKRERERMLQEFEWHFRESRRCVDDVQRASEMIRHMRQAVNVGGDLE